MTVIDEFRLDGRVAIVTGASSGLGADTAIALAEAGADVVLVARRVDKLEAIARAIIATGQRSLVVTTDVAIPAQCQAAVDSAIEHFGHVDILVNNAGISSSVPATRETPDEFRSVIDTNLSGAYWMAQGCGRVMGRGSSIINMSSVIGMTSTGLPQAAYAASKSGLIGLTRDLAQQWSGRRGIRVNAIAPGFFHTEMTDLHDADYVAKLSARFLIQRPGRGVELASTVVFLASDAAGYITGQTLIVDGGLTLT